VATGKGGRRRYGRVEAADECRPAGHGGERQSERRCRLRGCGTR
jgi:hypothetical protein